nr:hypothetical protein [Tanacetum cinerariifolium]
MDGIVHAYKARLVAKGYSQTYGVDYEETFSPVTDTRAIRILIAIAEFYDYEIWKINSYLNEDIYMVQPEGFVDPNHPRKSEEVEFMQNVPHASTVGSIMYAVRCTRPDVALAQNLTSCFQQNPGEQHWTDLKTILKGAVDWKSSKQSITAMSATEAEYIVASEAAMKAVWIRKFISGLGIVPTINEPIKMFCDNSAALQFANEPRVQMGARHYYR